MKRQFTRHEMEFVERPATAGPTDAGAAWATETYSFISPMIAGMTGPVALGDRLGVRWCALCPKLR
jgi:hypothetical protein